MQIKLPTTWILADPAPTAAAEIEAACIISILTSSQFILIFPSFHHKQENVFNDIDSKKAKAEK